MEKMQFLYQLKLIPSLLDKSNWTDKENNNIVQHHFKELQNLQKEGKLILAGRTLNMDPSGFGIVMLEVNSEEEAKMLMENDPAVKEGIMTAILFPYRVALIKN